MIDEYQKLLTERLFEAHLLRKGLSVYETTPHLVQGYLYGLVARGGSVTCLRRHWRVLGEYFEFLVWKGCFHQNPVARKTFPRWGAEKFGPKRKKPPKLAAL